MVNGRACVCAGQECHLKVFNQMMDEIKWLRLDQPFRKPLRSKTGYIM